MREYDACYEEGQKISKVVCNACGKEIEKDIHGYFADYLHVEKSWGYQSGKDGAVHEFDICEECYNHWVSGFVRKV